MNILTKKSPIPIITTGKKPLEAVFHTDFPDCGEPVRKKDSVEMVDLVLEGAGEKSIGLDDERGAVKLRQGGFDIHGSADFAAYALDAETALEADILFLPVFKSGVDEDERHDLIEFRVLAVHFQVGNAFGIMGDIDYREPQVTTDLRSGQSYPVRIDHCFEHFSHEREDAVVDGLDGAALLAKDGIAVLDDGKGHELGKGNGVSHGGSSGNCLHENTKPRLAPLRSGSSFGL